MNDQEEKREGFSPLKYQGDRNTLLIKSNLYKLASHYLKDKSIPVACTGDNCVFCKNGYQKKTEYRYYVKLNGQLGIVDIKPTVFFAIQEHAKTLEKEARKVKWVVTKKGAGLETKYTVTPVGELTPEDWDTEEKERFGYNQKLQDSSEKREEWLNQKYIELQGSVTLQTVQQPKKEEETVEEPEEASEEEITSDDIPF